MGLISITLPTIGDPNSTEDVDIRNSLATFQTLVNGNIDNANVAAAAAIAVSKLAIKVGTGTLTIPNGASTASISVTHNLGAIPQFAVAVNITAGSGTYHGTAYSITARALNSMTVEGHNLDAYSSGIAADFLWLVL